MSCEGLLNTQSYLDGELTGAEAAEAERHLQTCAECQAFAVDAAELSDGAVPGNRHQFEIRFVLIRRSANHVGDKFSRVRRINRGK